MDLYRLDQEHSELSLRALVRGRKLNLDKPNVDRERNAAGTITSNQSALITPRCTHPCVFLSSKSEGNQLQNTRIDILYFLFKNEEVMA